MGIIIHDERVNFRRLNIDSCRNCEFMFEDFDFIVKIHNIPPTLFDDKNL